MRIKRNRPQINEQECSLEEEQDKMEASNLSHREFRIMIKRYSTAWKNT